MNEGEDYYFTIYNSGGETTVYWYTRKEILKRIEGDGPDAFFEEFPHDPDTNYWELGKTLIIKGRVVSPKPVEVVKEYTIE